MGTMTFGNQADEKTSFRIMDMAYDAGVDFYDTAEMYPVPPDASYVGVTEEIVGRWLKTKDRDAIILATKVVGPGHGWITPPLRGGRAWTGTTSCALSRAACADWIPITSTSTRPIGPTRIIPMKRYWT
jgi:aryl-alcohol dehydrogenase-like predicted oxidoreductase